jgi:hypothetical protein
MNAPVPSDTCPQYPTSRFRPSAASARIRNGMKMARKRYSFVGSKGMATKPMNNQMPIKMRSCVIGNTAWSAA